MAIFFAYSLFRDLDITKYLIAFNSKSQELMKSLVSHPSNLYPHGENVLLGHVVKTS